MVALVLGTSGSRSQPLRTLRTHLCTSHPKAFWPPKSLWSKPSWIYYKSHRWPMTTPDLQRTAWHQNLILTLDGRRLRDVHLVPYVHRWVKDGTSIMSGHRYCAAISLRAGALPTRERRSRGTNLEPYCNHCGPPCWEYLGHIVQGCPRTQAIRNYCHNLIVSKVSRMLRNQGWQIWLEPASS